MGVLFETTRALNKIKKANKTLGKIRIDIRMGMSAKEISKKYNISISSAKNHIRYYSKTLEKQKEMGLYE